jgi:hypothetical protein
MLANEMRVANDRAGKSGLRRHTTQWSAALVTEAGVTIWFKKKRHLQARPADAVSIS